MPKPTPEKAFEVALRYLHKGSGTARISPSTGGGDTGSETGTYISQPILMKSARGKNTSLDHEGFVLRKQITKVKNFYDDDAITNLYEDEIRQLVLGGVCGDEASHPAIILICRSGKRSLEAGQLLLENGFDHVYNINEGFEGELDENHQRSTIGGWRFRGLPWEQC